MSERKKPRPKAEPKKLKKARVVDPLKHKFKFFDDYILEQEATK